MQSPTPMRALLCFLVVGCSAEPLLPEGDTIDDIGDGKADICGGDDESRGASCYADSEPMVYAKSRAVLRLQIGTGWCTAFLIGDQGHILTNHHCVHTQEAASTLRIELMAEGESCTTKCANWGGCTGTTINAAAELIRTGEELDYTLLKLPELPGLDYLQLRRSGAIPGERIYIPQHPGGAGKRIAIETGTGFATIGDRIEHFSTCPGTGPEIVYDADTNPGASGSPVVAYDDHAVVALHHCGTCAQGGNKGIPIELVIDELGDALPASAFSE
jgi:lysyl endopeptidase